MVGGGHQKLFNIILFNGLHPFNALSAPVLAAEMINAHAFDVAKLCHGDDCIAPGDQILHGNVVFIITNGSSSVIPVFIGDCLNLLADHA